MINLSSGKCVHPPNCWWFLSPPCCTKVTRDSFCCCRRHGADHNAKRDQHSWGTKQKGPGVKAPSKLCTELGFSFFSSFFVLGSWAGRADVEDSGSCSHRYCKQWRGGHRGELYCCYTTGIHDQQEAWWAGVGNWQNVSTLRYSRVVQADFRGQISKDIITVCWLLLVQCSFRFYFLRNLLYLSSSLFPVCCQSECSLSYRRDTIPQFMNSWIFCS